MKDDDDSWPKRREGILGDRGAIPEEPLGKETGAAAAPVRGEGTDTECIADCEVSVIFISKQRERLILDIDTQIVR